MTQHVPILRFSEFTDEWQPTKLGEIATFSKGAGISKEDIVEDGHTKAIRYGELYTTYKERIGEVFSYTNLPTEKLVFSKKNDLIIPASGETHIDIATASSVLLDGIALSGDINIIRSRHNTIFLAYYLNSKKKIDIAKLAQGVSVIHLYHSNLRGLMLHLPSLVEQERIAETLAIVDERIAKTGRMLELLGEYKRYLIQKLLNQEVNFKDGGSGVYADWRTVKLGKLEDEGSIELGRGNVISKVDIADHPGHYPIFSSSVKNEGLFGMYGKYMFDEELITWSVDGGGHFFYRKKQRFSVTNVSGWMRVLGPDIDCRFLALQLQLLHERQVFNYTTKAHPSIIRDIYKLKLPCVEEQRKIAAFVTMLDAKIKVEEARLSIAKQWKEGLLQRMFV